MNAFASQDTRLKNYVDRLFNLEREKQELNVGKKEILKEMKSEGFNTKIVLKVIQLLKADPEKLELENDMLEMYFLALNQERPALDIESVKKAHQSIQRSSYVTVDCEED